jgi:LysR family transcriptional regulator (chromosome initiation inhibitor)
MGWALNPIQLARPYLEREDLVELFPGKVLEQRLFWQINRLAADQLNQLSRSILSVARRELTSPA